MRLFNTVSLRPIAHEIMCSTSGNQGEALSPIAGEMRLQSDHDVRHLCNSLFISHIDPYLSLQEIQGPRVNGNRSLVSPAIHFRRHETNIDDVI